MPKISQLNTISTLTTSSVLPVVDNGETQKVTLHRVVEFVSASLDNSFATEIELLRSASAITSSLNEFASASVLSVATKLSTASFESYTASVQTINTSSLLLSSSFNSFTSSYKVDSASFDSRVDGLEALTGSYLTSLNGAISGSGQIINLGFATTSSVLNIDTSSLVTTSSFNLFSASINTSTSSLNTFTSSINTTIKSKLNTDGVISGSSQVLNSSNVLSSSVEGFTAFSSSVNSRIVSAGGSTDVSMFLSQSIFNTFSGSINTFTSSINSATASIYTTTASLNSKTGSYATTGSNTFNGNQTITGSLTVNSLTTISSSISANSSSLYLTSGSNLYVQNNGLVEITGSLVVSGSANLIVSNLSIGTGSGDEGGEIQLAIPQTNTTLTNKVLIDVYRDKLRLWQGDANSKGVSIDLSKAPDGVGGELTWKVSNFVAVGTFVSLDNIKCTITASGQRGLSIGAVSTTFEADLGGYFTNASGVGGGSANNITYTTTASTSAFGWNFVGHGDTVQVNLRDKTNNRFYRITMMIGVSYISNFISIERLF